MLPEPKHVLGMIKELIQEHTEMNYEDIRRGEVVAGDINDEEDGIAVDIDLMQMTKDGLRLDLADETAFLIRVEQIQDPIPLVDAKKQDAA